MQNSLYSIIIHWLKEETRLLNKISCYLNLLSTLTPFSWKQIMLKFREFSIILLYFFILYFFLSSGWPKIPWTGGGCIFFWWSHCSHDFLCSIQVRRYKSFLRSTFILFVKDKNMKKKLWKYITLFNQQMKGEVVFEMDSLQLDVTLTITNDKLK